MKGIVISSQLLAFHAELEIRQGYREAEQLVMAVELLFPVLENSTAYHACKFTSIAVSDQAPVITPYHKMAAQVMNVAAAQMLDRTPEQRSLLLDGAVVAFGWARQFTYGTLRLCDVLRDEATVVERLRIQANMLSREYGPIKSVEVPVQEFISECALLRQQYQTV